MGLFRYFASLSLVEENFKLEEQIVEVCHGVISRFCEWIEFGLYLGVGTCETYS